MRARRYVAGLLVAGVLWGSVAPVFAIPPLLVGGVAVEVFMAVGAYQAVAGGDTGSATPINEGQSASLVGQRVDAVIVTKGGEAVGVPLTSEAALDRAAPPPAAPAVSPIGPFTGKQPGDTSSFAQRCYMSDYKTSGCGVAESHEVCAQWAGGAGSGAFCRSIGPNAQVLPYAYFPSGAQDGCPSGLSCSKPAENGCTNGYAVSGSSCVLDNARATNQDGRHDFMLSPTGGLAARPGEADAVPAFSSAAEGVGKISGVNASGQPFVTTISPGGSSGPSTITTARQVGSSVMSEVVTVDAQGVVTGVTSSAAAGSLTSTGSGVPQVTLTGGGTGGGTTTFPDDYAREATTQAQLSKLARIGSDIGAIKQQVAEKVDQEDPPTFTAEDFNGIFFPHMFDDLKAYRLPVHASDCPSPEFSALGFDFAITSHCDLLESNRTMIEAMWAAFWVVVSLFIVLRA